MPSVLGQAFPFIVANRHTSHKGGGSYPWGWAVENRGREWTDTPKCTGSQKGTVRGKAVLENEKTLALQGFFSWAIQDLNL